MLGKTKSLDIPANISIKKDQIKIKTEFKVNRQDFGMNYASDHNLSDDKWINPGIELKLDLKAIPAK